MALKVWGGGTGPVDGAWDTGTNWTGDTIPANGDDVLFDATDATPLTSGPSLSVSLVSLEFTGYLGLRNNQPLNNNITITSSLIINTGNNGSDQILVNLSDVSTLTLQDNSALEFAAGSSIRDATVVANGSWYLNTLGSLECKGQNNLSLDSGGSFNFQNSLEEIDHAASNVQSGTLNWSGGQHWVGQTFTFASSTDISCVSLAGPLANLLSREEFRIEIYNTTAGLPSGAPLAESDDFRLNEKLNGGNAYFFLNTGYLTLAAGTYAFVLRPLSNFRFPAVINTDTANNYAGGTLVESNDGGSSWSSSAGIDLVFRVKDLSITDITTNDSMSFESNQTQLLNIKVRNFTINGNVGGDPVTATISPLFISALGNLTMATVNIGSGDTTEYDLNIEASRYIMPSGTIGNTVSAFDVTPIKFNAGFFGIITTFICDTAGSYLGDIRGWNGIAIVSGSAQFQYVTDSMQIVMFDQSEYFGAAVSVGALPPIIASSGNVTYANRRVGGSF